MSSEFKIAKFLIRRAILGVLLKGEYKGIEEFEDLHGKRLEVEEKLGTI